MPGRPTQTQLDQATNAWQAAAERLRTSFLADLAALRRRTATDADGYEGQSFDGSSHHGGSSGVERAVIRRSHGLLLERQALQAFLGLAAAWSKMGRALDAIREDDTTGEAAVSEAANDAGGFCVNCARHGVQNPREAGRAGARCGACRRYRTDHGTDRPRPLVLSCDRRRRFGFDQHHRRAAAVRALIP